MTNEPKSMMRGEREAYSDGALAFRRGLDFKACNRRAVKMKLAWQKGFEDERRRAFSEKATPEQLAASRENLEKIKAHFSRKNLRSSAQSADAFPNPEN